MDVEKAKVWAHNIQSERPVADIHLVVSCCPFSLESFTVFSNHVSCKLISCEFGVQLTVDKPLLTPSPLDIDAGRSRVIYKLPEARWSCLCWPWCRFLGWVSAMLSLNRPDTLVVLWPLWGFSVACVFVCRDKNMKYLRFSPHASTSCLCLCAQGLRDGGKRFRSPFFQND